MARQPVRAGRCRRDGWQRDGVGALSRSTARYRFEFQLFDWAESHVRAFAGRRVALFIGLRDDGSIRRAYFGSNAAWSEEQRASMMRAHPRWLMFVPHPDAGRGYLEWSGLPRALVARWTGGSRPSDFQDIRGEAALDHWPETWRVVVG